MKLLKGLLSIFILLAVVSCTTTEKKSDSMDRDDIISDTSSDKSNLVEKDIEEFIYLVTREESFYGDGQVDTITTYTYNDDYNLVSKVQTNEQGEVLSSYINTYNDGKLLRTNNLGLGNVLNNYSTFEYSGDLVIKETMYDNEDKIQTVNEYSYDGQNLISWRTLNSDGGVLAITEYEYDKNDNCILVSIKDALGATDGSIKKIYKKNLLVEESTLGSNGKLEKSTKYIYDGVTLIEKVYFDQRGNKKRSETYEFNSSLPVPNRINLLYNSGNLESYTLVDYDEKVITRTILVEE